MIRIPFPQAPDYPAVEPGFDGPKVAAIHGLLGHDLMRKHLLRMMRESGYLDTTMYSHLHPTKAIADDLSEAAGANRRIAIVGYSQGGFEAIKVARELARRDITVDLVVTIAAGGLGRTLPAQWGFNPRKAPANVFRCLNFFSEGDRLGSDQKPERNLMKASQSGQYVENIVFPKDEHISHIRLVICYPESRVHPTVRARLLDPLQNELASLTRQHHVSGNAERASK